MWVTKVQVLCAKCNSVELTVLSGRTSDISDTAVQLTLSPYSLVLGIAGFKTMIFWYFMQPKLVKQYIQWISLNFWKNNWDFSLVQQAILHTSSPAWMLHLQEVPMGPDFLKVSKNTWIKGSVDEVSLTPTLAMSWLTPEGQF